MKIATHCILMVTVILIGCATEPTPAQKQETSDWQQTFDEQLQLNGHRNWILVVDKAFPQQPGMKIINTNQKLLPVLEKVLAKIKSSTHVKPIIYNDAELQYITDSLAPGASQYKADLQKVLANFTTNPLLHDSVFVKMDAAARLFTITVLKTEEVIPYSSVFLQLDCAYWGADQERKLREIMKANQSK